MSYFVVTNLFLTIISSILVFLVFPKHNLKEIAFAACLSIFATVVLYIFMDILFQDSALGKDSVLSAFGWQSFSGKSICADGIYGVAVGAFMRMLNSYRSDLRQAEKSPSPQVNSLDLLKNHPRPKIVFQFWVLLVVIAVLGFMEYVLPWFRR